MPPSSSTIAVYGGTIGTELAAKAPPDGYTIVVVSGSHTINPSLYKKLPFDSVRDFAPVAMLVTGPGLLVVHPSLPARNVRELIALARVQPGKLLYASAGNGTPPHLAAELFKLMRDERADRSCAVQGQRPGNDRFDRGPDRVVIPDHTVGIAARAERRKLRALGRSTERAPRRRRCPDRCRAIAEGGRCRRYEGSAWYGVLAPAGTPTIIVSRLTADLQGALRAPDLKEKLVAQGLEPAAYSPKNFPR